MVTLKNTFTGLKHPPCMSQGTDISKFRAALYWLGLLSALYSFTFAKHISHSFKKKKKVKDFVVATTSVLQ